MAGPSSVFHPSPVSQPGLFFYSSTDDSKRGHYQWLRERWQHLRCSGYRWQIRSWKLFVSPADHAFQSLVNQWCEGFFFGEHLASLFNNRGFKIEGGSVDLFRHDLGLSRQYATSRKTSKKMDCNNLSHSWSNATWTGSYSWFHHWPFSGFPNWYRATMGRFTFSRKCVNPSNPMAEWMNYSSATTALVDGFPCSFSLYWRREKSFAGHRDFFGGRGCGEGLFLSIESCVRESKPVTWRQVRPSKTAAIVVRLKPSDFAMNVIEFLASFKSMACWISATVKIARGWFSPCLAMFLFLPRSNMSAVFCLCVPRTRCCGLTQVVWSHIWRTINPAGIFPW